MTDRGAGPGRGAATVGFWDKLLRMFHWGFVAAFVTAWLWGEEVQPIHELAGCTAAGLGAFRPIWGFAGRRHARFAQFVKGPGARRAPCDIT